MIWSSRKLLSLRLFCAESQDEGAASGTEKQKRDEKSGNTKDEVVAFHQPKSFSDKPAFFDKSSLDSPNAPEEAWTYCMDEEELFGSNQA